VNLQPGFVILEYESENRLSSYHKSFITIHIRIQTSYIPGGGLCFRLGSGRQESIKFSVRVLSPGGTENGDILFRLGVCNNRGKLSYRDDELVSF
jgi:hypothetical protein